MPTRWDYHRLAEYIDYVEATINGVLGRKLIGLQPPHYIFLPCNGMGIGGSVRWDGRDPYYWTSTYEDERYATYYGDGYSSTTWLGYNRYVAMAVRACATRLV